MLNLLNPYFPRRYRILFVISLGVRHAVGLIMLLSA
jgi:hypothetical protein